MVHPEVFQKLIIRCTAKLGKKIGETLTQSLPLSSNPFVDWSAHLFTTNRKQYILVTNTATLYSLVMYGRGITTPSRFMRHFNTALCEFMQADGLEEAFEKRLAPAFATVSFSKSLNRSVTGSMNDLIYMAKVHLLDSAPSLVDVSSRLNEVPMSYLKYRHPRKAFLEILE